MNTLFGVSTGLGFGLFTFDWTQIIWIGSPLVMPWWAQVNYLIGFVGFYWIVVPILYFTNVSRSVSIAAHLPGVVHGASTDQRYPGGGSLRRHI